MYESHVYGKFIIDILANLQGNPYRASRVGNGSNMMLPIDFKASFHCNSSGHTLLWVHQNQRYCKNRKESMLKNPQSILEIGLTIADVGAKSANRGSTSLWSKMAFRMHFGK